MTNTTALPGNTPGVPGHFRSARMDLGKEIRMDNGDHVVGGPRDDDDEVTEHDALTAVVVVADSLRRIADTFEQLAPALNKVMVLHAAELQARAAALRQATDQAVETIGGGGKPRQPSREVPRPLRQAEEWFLMPERVRGVQFGAPDQAIGLVVDIEMHNGETLRRVFSSNVPWHDVKAWRQHQPLSMPERQAGE